jgi:predicted O-methyltransferase YrrM
MHEEHLDGLAQADAIDRATYELFYGQLPLPDQRQVNVFKQYLRFVNFAFHVEPLDNMLELGAGFSTVLLARLAQFKQCQLFTVDIACERLLNRLKEGAFAEELESIVEVLEGSSISTEDFWSIYGPKEHSTVAGISVTELKQVLPRFISRQFGVRKWTQLEELLGKPSQDIDPLELFFEDGRLGFPEDILNIFSQAGDELDFYSREGSEKSGVLDELLQQTECFDLVFFDSGELSSLPEWIKLKDHIRPGGIAVFHDIYFPKSFKNFLTCSAVTVDPKWQVIYQDRSTPQGLLIAVKQPC